MCSCTLFGLSIASYGSAASQRKARAASLKQPFMFSFTDPLLSLLTPFFSQFPALWLFTIVTFDMSLKHVKMVRMNENKNMQVFWVFHCFKHALIHFCTPTLSPFIPSACRGRWLQLNKWILSMEVQIQFSILPCFNCAHQNYWQPMWSS